MAQRGRTNPQEATRKDFTTEARRARRKRKNTEIEDEEEHEDEDDLSALAQGSIWLSVVSHQSVSDRLASGAFGQHTRDRTADCCKQIMDRRVPRVFR